jgi:GTPase
VVSGVSKAPINPETLELAGIFRLPLIVVITHLDLMDKTMELEAVLRIKE